MGPGDPPNPNKSSYTRLGTATITKRGGDRIFMERFAELIDGVRKGYNMLTETRELAGRPEYLYRPFDLPLEDVQPLVDLLVMQPEALLERAQAADVSGPIFQT